jgi:hypothetical protein
MSEPYIKFLKKVSSILDTYPSEDQLFGTTRKVVLILDDKCNRIYKFLVSKYNPYKQFNKQLSLVPNIPEAENATFVFYDTEDKVSKILGIANRIYLRKIIFSRPIEAKVLIEAGKLPYDFCESCMGYHDCKFKSLSDRSCFCNEEEDCDSKMQEHFFKFLGEQLKFEETDFRYNVWPVKYATMRTVSKIYSTFKKDIQNFAHSVCNYLAPVEAYKNTTISMQNETYIQLQMTNGFNYYRFDLLPSNFEGVYQRMNITNATIQQNWTDIREKHQYLRDWKYFIVERQRLDQQFNFTKTGILVSTTPVEDEEEEDKLDGVSRQISEYQDEYMQSSFRNVIARKFEDVAGEFLLKIVAKHTENFSKPLQKLDIWLEANFLSLEMENKTSWFFENLEHQLDKYFGDMNTNLISFWFYNYLSQVPHDWEARLIGFDMDDRFLVTGYLQRDLETYLPKISEFSQFINFVNYAVRESFGVTNYTKFIEYADTHQIFGYSKKVSTLYYKRKDFKGNWSQFFMDWREIFPVFSTENIKLVTLLESEYQSKFINVTIDHELPNLWRCVERGLFFMQDYCNAQFSDNFKLLAEKTISQKFKEKQLSLLISFKKNFIAHRVLDLIRHESPKVDPVVTHAYTTLIQHFKRELNDWHSSQPYKRLDFLKYNYYDFDYFFKRFDIAFSTMNLEFPEEDYEYLKYVKMQFDVLQNRSYALGIEEKISTRWDWGHGLRIGMENSRNAAVSLRSPINFGIKTMMSAAEVPSASVSIINSILLLASVLLMKIKKIKWKF